MESVRQGGVKRSAGSRDGDELTEDRSLLNGVKVVLLDIEGTTTSISFVKVGFSFFI